MTWAVTAIGTGAAVSAGGSIAGGLLSQPNDPDVFLPPTFNPQSNPLLAANTFDLLASQGFLNPSVLAQAGPLAQAREAWRAQPRQGVDAGQFSAATTNSLQGAFLKFQRNGRLPTWLRAGSQDPRAEGVRQIARNFGMSVEQLFAAETQYQQQVEQATGRFGEIASLSGDRRLEVERQLMELVGDGRLNVQDLREQELVRLNRDLDEQEDDLLRRSNQRFNPGRGLEGINDARTDADLIALTRALGLLQGEAQSANTLQSLNPGNRAQAFGPSVVGSSTPQVLPGGAVINQGQDPFGAAVAQAGNTLGSGISNLGILSLLNNQSPTINTGTGSTAPGTGGNIFADDLFAGFGDRNF